MAVKAVVVINSIAVLPAQADQTFTISYSVAINNNGVGLNFAADVSVRTAQTIPQFQTAAKNKIVDDCAGRGITLTPADVIIFATPF